MLYISYSAMLTAISCIWLMVRLFVWIRTRQFDWRRELQLILVYICIIVVVRFTFCPFGKVNGQIQPLVFDPSQMFPFRVNLVPFVYLLDYPDPREAVLNFVGNTAMFIPLGVIWPLVFRELNTHRKVLVAGVCCSLCIELLQLPFFDRVSDVDDLILNSLGFTIGYLLYLMVKTAKKKIASHFGS